MAVRFPIPMIELANAHEHWLNREIHELVLADIDSTWINTKRVTVESITPYSEPGEMAPTIWFEVRYSNGGIVRHNGSHVASVGFREISGDDS